MTEASVTTRKRKGGRPRATNPRSRSVTVRFTEDEYAALMDRCAGDVSEHVRRAALGRRSVARTIPEANREIWRSLAPTTTNLNHLAGAVLSGKVIGALQLEPVIRNLVTQIDALRRSLIGADQPEGEEADDP